ncbi:MAG: divalent-cation tolerance protein CutA [Verrucomicrobiae bacterium]|nr:divalent-cation tolerance protein CutA [Verrucomicrobiae bacterium]MDW8309180.1 divalent-cation tolerance protein CutA [Verrucomicrobiales bacterium]
MKTATGFLVVLVTAPDLQTARRLAQAALRAKLVACVNLVPKVESHYWWQGKLERSGEVLLLLKATRRALPELERLIRERHPYETPEFIALPLTHGSAQYLTWWAEACGATSTRG